VVTNSLTSTARISNGCGMIYRRVKELAKPVAGVGARSSKDDRQSQISFSTKQAKNSKGGTKGHRNLNDIKRYRGILLNFKRIRVISRDEPIDSSIAPSSPVEETDEASADVKQDWDSFPSATSSCYTRRCPHPAAEWKYYFCEQDTLEVEDMKHAMLIQLCGDAILAPVKPMLGASSHIIDMGAGSTIWAIDSEQR